MGGCLSKKAKEDPNATSLLGSKKKAEGSRDPPQTESLEEEKVKEVLSETPTRFVRGAKVGNGLKTEGSDLGSYINGADLCSSRSVGVLQNPQTPSESISAASTSVISDNTRAAAPDDEDDDDEEEGETAEMKLDMMLMKKKKMRSLSSSSLGMPRSPSPASNTRGRAPQPPATVAGRREYRGVDVGCRNGRPSPSPMRPREMGINARNYVSSSPCKTGKTGDMVLTGERSGGRTRMRSVSPAAAYSLKSRSSELEAAAAATAKASIDHQHRQRKQHCRSLSSSSVTNGRFSPQKIPASWGGGGAGDGMTKPMEESLENPLVSMECFIFL